MIIDANALPENHNVEADICIVGAGAAGISLATAFRNSGLKIAILESGGFYLDRDTQSLYSGTNVGIPYLPLDGCRLRYFGGTTNHWAGQCDPFEDFDFESREGIPYTGWPISRTDLDTYYDKAAAFCNLESDQWSNAYWESRDSSQPLRFESDRIKTKIVQIIESTGRRYGALYRDEVTEAEDIEVYLNANVTQIEVDEYGQQVTHVEVATLAGKHSTVRARQFILAAGGIENPRLLLLSDKRHPNGLGNEHGTVGRFFNEHPRFTAGRIFPTAGQLDVSYYDTHSVDGTRIKPHMILDRRLVEQEQLVDVQMKLTPNYDERYRNALRAKSGSSLVYMVKSIADGRAPDDFARHLSRVVFDVENLPLYIYSKLREDDLPVSHIDLVTRMDAVPNPDSRVKLSETERDLLGQRKLELDWRLSEIDRRSAVRAIEIFAEELGRSGLGRVQMLIDKSGSDWPADTSGGSHHMGTTRMSDDPKTGVVDRNCKVHGIANLYVAGSSVFSTGGSGSPTFTLIALALRLADHLKSGMA